MIDLTAYWDDADRHQEGCIYGVCASIKAFNYLSKKAT